MSHTLPHTGPSPAFTLVELLVAITIIVILLALLTPAVDRAIYQAELAVCAAQLRGVGSASHQYVLHNKRSYPHRAGMRAHWEPEMLYEGNPNGPQHDTRKTIKGYVDLKALVDPLCKKVDLSLNSTNTNLDPNQIWVLSSYNIWWDAQYNSGALRFKGLFRLGDRFTWRNPADPNAPEYAFNLLISDRDTYNPSPGAGNEAHFSHPDADGKMVNEVLQDEDFTANTDVPGVEVPNDHVTISFWRLRTSHQRGKVDGNYAYDDGSVIRYHRIGIADERMVRIPEWINHSSWGSGNGWGTQVPRAN